MGWVDYMYIHVDLTGFHTGSWNPPLVGTHAYAHHYHPATILFPPPQLKILYETLYYMYIHVQYVRAYYNLLKISPPSLIERALLSSQIYVQHMWLHGYRVLSRILTWEVGGSCINIV